MVSAVAGDDWPGNAAGTILPGGFSVANNKLYILGGFNINVAMTNQIWEYDPNGGTHWTQKVNLPVTRGYIPATTIGGLIYTGGGSDYTTTVIDTAELLQVRPDGQHHRCHRQHPPRHGRNPRRDRRWADVGAGRRARRPQPQQRSGHLQSGDQHLERRAPRS